VERNGKSYDPHYYLNPVLVRKAVYFNGVGYQ
jgi:hypothetical protein